MVNVKSTKLHLIFFLKGELKWKCNLNMDKLVVISKIQKSVQSTKIYCIGNI